MNNKQFTKILPMILTVAAMLVFISMVGATPKVSNKIFPSWANVKRKAESCLKSGDYSQARQIYTTILAQWPQTRLALEAQKNLVILDIITGSEKVPLVLGKFLADYSDYSPMLIDSAFRDILIHYEKRKEIDNIIDLYQHFLSKYPSDPQIMWAQSSLAIYYIQQNEDTKAEAAVEKLLADFSDHPEIANAVTGIANRYQRERKIDNAIKLYQYILSKYPSDPEAMWAQSGLAKCYIMQNQDVKAEAVIEKLLANFPDHPKITKTINRIANLYHKRKTDRAIELYQHILSKYPSDPQAMWAQSGLAKCYVLQNENVKAEAAIEKLLASFSNYPEIAQVIGRKIRRIRRITKTNIINQKYVLDNWISADKPLQIQKIGLLFCIEYFDNKTASDALEKFMAGLAKYPDSANIINEIADYCSELKKHEIAVKLYQVYLNHYALESNKREIELKLYESMYLARMDLKKVLISLGKYVGRNKETNINLAIKALVLRGQIFAKLGEVDKAINQFLVIKNQYPEIKEFPEASFYVGYCYMLQGKFNQAKEALNLVVKDYPQSSFARRAKLQLNRIEEMDE